MYFEWKHVKLSFSSTQVWQVGWHHYWLSAAANCLTTQKFSLAPILPPTLILSFSLSLLSRLLSTQSVYSLPTIILFLFLLHKHIPSTLPVPLGYRASPRRLQSPEPWHGGRETELSCQLLRSAMGMLIGWWRWSLSHEDPKKLK